WSESSVDRPSTRRDVRVAAASDPGRPPRRAGPSRSPSADGSDSSVEPLRLCHGHFTHLHDTRADAEWAVEPESNGPAAGSPPGQPSVGAYSVALAVDLSKSRGCAVASPGRAGQRALWAIVSRTAVTASSSTGSWPGPISTPYVSAMRNHFLDTA